MFRSEMDGRPIEVALGHDIRVCAFGIGIRTAPGRLHETRLEDQSIQSPSPIQGYLAHKKLPSHRTLRWSLGVGSSIWARYPCTQPAPLSRVLPKNAPLNHSLLESKP